MKKIIILFMIMLLTTLLIVGCGDQPEEQRTEENTEQEEIIVIAREFIQLLSEEEYEEATKHFDETMKEQLTPAALEQLWVSLQEQVGKLVDQEYNSTEQSEGYQIVLIDGLFEGEDVVFRVSFNDKKQIAGFFIQ